jgi:hypothetical protein
MSMGLLSIVLAGCVHDPASSLRQPGDRVRVGSAPALAREQLRPYCPQSGAWIERHRTDTGATLGRITFLGEDSERTGFCRFYFGSNRTANFLSIGPIPIHPDEADAAGPALANLFPLRVGNTASYSFVARHSRGPDTSAYRITYTVLREESVFHSGANRNVFVVARSSEGQFNNISRVQDVYRIDRQTLLPLGYQQIIERGVGDQQPAWTARLSSGLPTTTPVPPAPTVREGGPKAPVPPTTESPAPRSAGSSSAADGRASAAPAGNRGLLETNAISSSGVRLGRLTFPLPGPDWREIGRDVSSSASGERTQVLLGRWRDGRLEGLLNVEANTSTVSNPDFEPPRLCSRTDIYHSNMSARSHNNYNCFGVNHLVFTPDRSLGNRWGQLYRMIEPTPGMPRTLIASQFQIASGGNFVNYTMYVNPEMYGFERDARSWAESGWHVSRATPRHQEFLARVRAWSELYRQPITSALRGTAGREAEAPSAGQQQTNARSVENTLARLQEQAQLQRASGGSPSVAARLTQAEARALSEQIGACWRVDAGILGLQDIAVELRVQLDGQGNVRNIVPGDRGVPNDPRSLAVYESARLALLSPQCNPLRVPPDKHRAVMESIFRFNPRGLVQ